MLKGIDVNQRISWTYDGDESEPKTEFVLRPLSGADMVGLKDLGLVGMVSACLVEVKHFDGPEDKDAIVKSLPPSVFSALAQEVNAINNFTGEDEKNS